MTIGIYMSILWIADLCYSAMFVLIDLKWASSSFCFTAFAISLNFNIISPLLLCFLSLERYMVVKYPLGSSFKTVSFVMRWIIITYTITATFTISMTFVMKYFYTKVPLYICSPFVDPTNSVTLMKALTWFIAFFQVITIIFIVATYNFMLKEIRKCKQYIQKHMSKNQNAISMTIQLIIITGSNILCWIPSITIHTIPMFMDQYPINMIIWTTVAVSPINSIINPIVFIMAVIRKQ